MAETFIVARSWTSTTLTIGIGPADYEYTFASQADIHTIVTQFNFSPGRALAMAKRHASEWRKLERQTNEVA